MSYNPMEEMFNPLVRRVHLTDLVARIRYKDWQFIIRPMGAGDLLQVRFSTDNSQTGQQESWGGRKWYLSAHATDAEVVQTALKAVLTAEEHEAREQFLYQGRAIFHPHISLEALFENASRCSGRTSSSKMRSASEV